MDILKNTKPFWNPIKGGKVNIHSYKLRMFLSLCGFGQFASTDSGTSSKSIFYNDEDVLKIHDERSIKRWVREWLESVDESEFGRGGLLDTSTPQMESCDKWDVLEQWQKLNQTSFKNLVLDDLPIHSEEGFADTETINLFSDTKDSCHIRFKNGVVKITKDNIQLLESSKVRAKGAVLTYFKSG